MKVTRQDVAELAKVSPSAVSYVLNKTPGARIKEETRKRIVKAAAELGYRPNIFARSLVLQRSHNIGIAIPHIDAFAAFGNFHFSETIKGIGEIATDSGYSLTLSFSDRDGLDYTELFRERRVDGLIIMHVGTADHLKILKLKEESYPFILVNYHLDGENVSFVDSDNVGGAFKATEHLIKLGHKRIALVNGGMGSSNFRDRFEGYKMALKKYDLKFDRGIAFQVHVGSRDIPLIIKKLLGKKCDYPRAIFAGNDAFAVEAVNVIRKMGLSVPEDIAIVGFDDIPLAAYFSPPLTTVRQSIVEIGRVAAEELINLLGDGANNKKQIKRVLKTELIVRQSCGAKLKNVKVKGGEKRK